MYLLAPLSLIFSLTRQPVRLENEHNNGETDHHGATIGGGEYEHNNGETDHLGGETDHNNGDDFET